MYYIGTNYVINNNDKIYIELKKNKMKIHDLTIPNIKIKVHKNINPESNKGKYILYYLGYNKMQIYKKNKMVV